MIAELLEQSLADLKTAKILLEKPTQNNVNLAVIHIDFALGQIEQVESYLELHGGH